MEKTYKVVTKEGKFCVRPAVSNDVCVYNDEKMAVAECKKLINEYLMLLYKPGMSEQALFRMFEMFGSEAYFLVDDKHMAFSPWDYAEQSARDIVRNGPEFSE